MGKRDDILKATMKIIAQEGVMSATIGNILKKASTGYGTLYNYFDSKEDLYLTVYLDIVKGIDRAVSIDSINIIDSKQELITTLHRYLDYCFEHQTAFNALEALLYVPEICKMAEEKTSEDISFLSLINRCEEEGVIKKRDPQYNVSIILGMASNFIKYYYQAKTEVTEEKKQDFINSCIRALE